MADRGQSRDLRGFLTNLRHDGELHDISAQVSAHLEMTEVSRRVLAADGPALLFSHASLSMPVLTNLFGSERRIVRALGLKTAAQLRELGELLAELQQPRAPEGIAELIGRLPQYRRVLAMPPKIVRKANCQQVQQTGSAVDLGQLPVQTCWPEDAGPLITWPLVATRPPAHGAARRRQNLAVYRLQVIDQNRLIVRWLAHRGGAQDYRAWCAAHPQEPFPLAVTIGADPASLLAAVTPVPDGIGELQFAGLLGGSRSRLLRTESGFEMPASGEILLEGHILPHDTAPEGPFGDHTGYYNEVESFPVMTVTRMSHRDDAIYHSTYTGRPPDEPAVLGLALNELFIPILKRQFPEIQDFHLPAEACSYRMAVVSIHKQYPGHAKRILFGLWSYLRQFMYTKYVVVVDDDIDVRSWPDIIWAITTRADPVRDTTLIDNTPIDYLDFASPTAGLGGKLGLDATNKWPGETQRDWGRVIRNEPGVVQRVDTMWDELGL